MAYDKLKRTTPYVNWLFSFEVAFARLAPTKARCSFWPGHMSGFTLPLRFWSHSETEKSYRQSAPGNSLGNSLCSWGWRLENVCSQIIWFSLGLRLQSYQKTHQPQERELWSDVVVQVWQCFRLKKSLKGTVQWGRNHTAPLTML